MNPNPNPNAQWFVALPGQPAAGPVAAWQIKADLASGRLPANAMIAEPGSDRWRPVTDLANDGYGNPNPFAAPTASSSGGHLQPSAGGIKAIGVLHIVFGGIWILIGLISAIASAQGVLMALPTIVLSLLLLIAGIGVLSLAPWGRVLSFVWASLSLLVAVIGFIAIFVAMSAMSAAASRFSDVDTYGAASTRAASFAAMGMGVMAVIILLWLVYPIITIVALARTRAFSRG